MNKIYIRFPITRDLVNTYRIYRRCGDTRDKAIARLRMEYKQELADCDDGPVVRIGIALALCQKDELTQSVLEEALVAIDKLLVEQWDGNMRSTFHELEVYIHDPQRLGDEAKYRVRKPYIPQWEVGDTFAHTLTHYMAKYVGVYGWNVIFRKVGEYVDIEQQYHQLVYVTMCPPERLPHTAEELRKLGFLRMMPHDGDKWDYLAQISFKSKKDEASYELTKIGTFPDAGDPEDRTIENPFVTMPLFGKLKRDSEVLSYENAVCRIYKDKGMGYDKIEN